MIRTLAALSAALVMTAGAASAAPRPSDTETIGTFAAGDAFPLHEPETAQLSRLVFEMGVCGRMLRSRWHDPAGILIAAEEIEIGEDGFRRYRYWRPNVQEAAVVTRNGSALQIKLEHAGRKEQRELTVDGAVQVGSLLALAHAETPVVHLGRQGPLQYLVPERMAAYTLDFSELSGTDHQGLEVRLQSGWPFLSRSKPVVVYFDAEGRIERLKGTTLPVDGTPVSKRPLELDVQVNRRYKRPCSPEPVTHPSQLTD